MISCPQNCQKHESVSSEQRILLVQKYHTRKDLVASLLSLNKALILDPLASNEQKKTRTDQLSVLRKLAKTAAAEYLQSLVCFQYGEEVWDVLPDGSTNPFQPSTWYQGPLHSTQARQDSRDVQERKKNSKCGWCDQFGHWYGDNMCDPVDVARKLAKLQAKDPQTHTAAELTALGLIHQPNHGQFQGN